MSAQNPLAIAMGVPADLDAPVVLLPYQQRWIQDDAQLKIAEKSRRIGLTWAEAADDVLIAAADKTAGGQNVYYVGYNQDMTIEFIEACAMWARAFNHAASEIEEGLWDDDDKQIKTFTIRFPQSNHRITALTSRPSNLRGKQGVVVLDEAAFHDDLPGMIKAALALLIWGGKVRIISTHDGDDNPFNELISEIRAGKRSGTVHRTTFREAVAEGLYKRVCLRLGIDYDPAQEEAWVQSVYDFYGDDAEEELDVVPSKGGGRWLSQALLDRLENPEIPVIRFQAPKDFETWTEDARTNLVLEWCQDQLLPLIEQISRNVISYYGLDFARKKDACSMWPLLEQQDRRLSCPFVLEMYQMPYKQQEVIMLYIWKRMPNLRKGRHDASGNGGYLAEAMQVSFGTTLIEAIQFSEGWYRDNTPSFKAALEDGVIMGIPKDRDIVDDHRAFRLVKGVARIPDTRTKGTDGNGRHGDSAIAHVLAHSASRNPEAPIEWLAAPTQEEIEQMPEYEEWRNMLNGGW